MLIINADDFGRSRLATDRTLHCCKQGSVSSTSAMVFMEDSSRAADLARESGIDVGLHLNFTQRLDGQDRYPLLEEYHARIASFLTRSRFNFLIYNPLLRQQFEYVFHAQSEEFERLYGSAPSHIDGHHHMHLCANMLFGAFIPEGRKVRRNFTFERGEKGLLNRTYRALIDKWLKRRYTTTDYLFSLPECIKTGRLARALELARSSNVEMETHPEVEEDYMWLTESTSGRNFPGLETCSYAQLGSGQFRKQAGN